MTTAPYTVTPRQVAEFVAALPGGTLSAIEYHDDPGYSLREAVLGVLGISRYHYSGEPRWPDTDPINDGPWSTDRARTDNMLSLAPLLCEWPSWSSARRRRWARAVALRTIREVLPLALDAIGLLMEADACRSVKGPSAATRAAMVARQAVEMATVYHSMPKTTVDVVLACALAAVGSRYVDYPYAVAAGGARAVRYVASALASARGDYSSADEALTLACRIWAEA